MPRRIFLACGIVASLLYVAIDILAAIRYPDYHSFTARAISELMARGAPTERLVDPPFLAYDVLMMAFGVGVWMSGAGRRVHVTGGLLFAYAAIGLLGPTVAEMNVRGSGGPPAADALHIALTGVVVLLILAVMSVGASIRGRAFRLYSIATLATTVVFGVLTSFAMRGIGTGEPTPWVGALERVNVGAFLLWVGVLAVSLLRAQPTAASSPRLPGDHMPPSALAAG